MHCGAANTAVRKVRREPSGGWCDWVPVGSVELQQNYFLKSRLETIKSGVRMRSTSTYASRSRFRVEKERMKDERKGRAYNYPDERRLLEGKIWAV